MLEQGLFYAPPVKQEKKGSRGGDTPPRALAPIPATNWVSPTEFPNLSSVKRFGFDTETYDPELKINGPGWARGKGFLCGVSIAVDDGNQWYFPLAHQLGGNMPAENTRRFLQDVMGNPRQEKVGANLIYDVGWLNEFGVEVKGPLRDVQFAEALLDDFCPSVSLEALGQKYVNEGKEDDLLYEWASASYGGKATRSDQGGNIWRCPVELVGPYAEKDAFLPLRIYDEQKDLLEFQDLFEVFDIECRLIPILIGMRQRGVRVDIPRCEEVSSILLAKQQEHENVIQQIAGREVPLFAADAIALAFDAVGESYPRTAKTSKPSFTQPWLESHSHPLARAIVAARKYYKARTTFVENYLLEKQVNGRIHGQFHPLRNDEGGAVSGRFSSSAPNLQNLPSRDPELGPLIRSLFIPDEGHLTWEKIDYSQIEYRFLAHFAVGKGANEIRLRYTESPNTDYHEATSQLISAQTGKVLSRYDTKRINFGLCYGMGTKTLAKNLEMEFKAALELFDSYHKGVPFTKTTFAKFSKQAETQKYVQTILRRRSRFIDKRGSHKGLNRVLQGSAADLMKKAMVDAYEAGLFDILGFPLLTVHDELDMSNSGTRESEQALEELIQVMQSAIQIKVPIIAERDTGTNWGNVK